MSGKLPIAFYVMVMAAVIVCVDVSFFRDRFRERLIANTGIVLAFAALYYLFARRT